MECLYVIRLGYWDRSKPIFSGEFKIQKETLPQIGKNKDLYHHMPIPELKLQMDEELLVKKAKRRPGLLVFRDGNNPRKMATCAAGIGKAPNPVEHVFAPVVSLRKEGNIGKDYPDDFIEIVKKGKIAALIYLPADGSILKNESMAILSQMQTHPLKTIEETDLRMDPLVLGTYLESFWQRTEAELL
jgi:hypothetical protein